MAKHWPRKENYPLLAHLRNSFNPRCLSDVTKRDITGLYVLVSCAGGALPPQ